MVPAAAGTVGDETLLPVPPPRGLDPLAPRSGESLG